MELDMSGILSPPWSIPVALSAPALFTQDGSGQGPGEILNQDNTLNTSANPAAPGSIVQMFVTGAGQTSPAGTTGAVALSNNQIPLLAVRARIGGANAKVIAATSIPNTPEGYLQGSVKIPEAELAGELPVVISIGGSSSRGAVTMFVR
jgi:uncharacterized protein (TIGR03437 family)